jgi:hypothetical protein
MSPCQGQPLNARCRAASGLIGQCTNDTSPGACPNGGRICQCWIGPLP